MFMDSDLHIVLEILMASGAVATAIMAFFIVQTFRKQRTELKTSHFIDIDNILNQGESREHRGILFGHYHKLQELIEKYPDSKDSDELNNLNELCKKLGVDYNRVGFITKNNRDLERDFIDFHGFAIGRIWKYVKPLYDKWESEDRISPYESFQDIGKKSYDQFSREIDQYIERKKNGSDDIKPII